MKKIEAPRALALNRELLIKLTTANLEHVVGGFDPGRMTNITCCPNGSCATQPPPK